MVSLRWRKATSEGSQPKRERYEIKKEMAMEKIFARNNPTR